MIYAITLAAEQRTLLDSTVLVPMVAGVAALAAFARRSLRREFPLLDLRLVKNRVYAAASVEVPQRRRDVKLDGAITNHQEESWACG